MKLTFAWLELPEGHFRPYCQSDRPKAQGVDPLAHALDDDGGLGVDFAVPWIEEGKRLANAALAGASGSQLWEREYFAMKFDGDQGVAFYMADPEYSEAAPTRTLLSVLQDWQDFLIAGPGAGPKIVEIETN